MPYCYGTATTADGCVVLLTELIAPGTTIAALRESREWARIEALKGSAEAAVERIHELGVLYRDAEGRNFLVCRDDGVVVVDFDGCGKGVCNTLKRKAWEDRVFVEGTFKVPVEESEDEEEGEEEETEEALQEVGVSKAMCSIEA